MSDDKKSGNNRLYIGIVATIVVIIIIAIIAAAPGIFGQKSTGTPATGTGLNTVRANVNKDCTGTPWFVGEQKGFFNSSGATFIDAGALDYSLQPAALISGQTDVYDGHPNTIIDLIKSVAKIHGVILSGAEPVPGNVSEEHMHWLVLNNSSLHTASDIPKFVQQNGRKVKIAVLALGICSDLETDAWLRENNISRDDVELVVLPDPNQEQALRSGEIDVACLHPPFYAAAEGHGGVRPLFTSRDAFGDAAGVSLLVFTDGFIKNHPDTVRKFARAYHEAEVWSNDHRAEAANITGKEIGLDMSNTHYYSNTGRIDDALIQKWIDAMVADGQLQPGEFKPSDLYTTEFSDVWGKQ